MGFQPVNNTAKFDCLFAIGHVKRAQFSVYVNNDAAPWDPTQLDGTAEDIADAIKASYVPVLSVDHDFLGVIGRDLEQQFGRVEERMEDPIVPGTLNEPTLPANVAVVGTFKSAIGAPRRGRIYLMPPTEGQVVGQLLSVGAQSDLQDAVQAISDGASLLGANSHVIVSRFSGSALAPPDAHDQVLLRPTARAAGIVADVAAVQVRRRTDSQRNRLSAEPA